MKKTLSVLAMLGIIACSAQSAHAFCWSNLNPANWGKNCCPKCEKKCNPCKKEKKCAPCETGYAAPCNPCEKKKAECNPCQKAKQTCDPCDRLQEMNK